MPAFSLPPRPAVLAVCLRSTTERSPTACRGTIPAADPWLRRLAWAPLHFRRSTTRPV